MTAPKQPMRKWLISVKRNLRIEDCQVSGSQVTPDCPFPWTIYKSVLHGGRQEGVDLISIDNGRLRFDIIPTRGMGLLKAEMGEIRLGWDSPVREVVHPRHIRLESRAGLGWLEGFNEWVVRCGLEFGGAPGRDRFITNTGDESEVDLTLHGKIANLPASEVELIVDRKPPFRLRVRGRVAESMMFGPALELQTEISTVPGSSTIRVRDIVTNQGASQQEFQLIYHCNYGPPILEEDSRFSAPVETLFPINRHSASGLDRFDRFEGPIPGFVEQVYCMKLFSGPEGKTRVLLQDRAAECGVRMNYSIRELPYLTLWKNTGPSPTGYVTGIEPGTGYPYNRSVERKFGRVPSIGPRESRSFEVEFSILDSAAAVRESLDVIEQLREGRVPSILEEPPEIPDVE